MFCVLCFSLCYVVFCFVLSLVVFCYVLNFMFRFVLHFVFVLFCCILCHVCVFVCTKGWSGKDQPAIERLFFLLHQICCLCHTHLPQGNPL